MTSGLRRLGGRKPGERRGERWRRSYCCCCCWVRRGPWGRCADEPDGGTRPPGGRGRARSVGLLWRAEEGSEDSMPYSPAGLTQRIEVLYETETQTAVAARTRARASPALRFVLIWPRRRASPPSDHHFLRHFSSASSSRSFLSSRSHPRPRPSRDAERGG